MTNSVCSRRSVIRTRHRGGRSSGFSSVCSGAHSAATKHLEDCSLARQKIFGHATLQVEISVCNDCALAPDNVV